MLPRRSRTPSRTSPTSRRPRRRSTRSPPRVHGCLDPSQGAGASSIISARAEGTSTPPDAGDICLTPSGQVSGHGGAPWLGSPAHELCGRHLRRLKSSRDVRWSRAPGGEKCLTTQIRKILCLGRFAGNPYSVREYRSLLRLR